MRAVLDTSGIISALFWDGAPRKVMNLAHFKKRIIKALLDGMIVKYQTKQLMGSLSS
jgi:predicted nucleic acid-binding protein